MSANPLYTALLAAQADFDPVVKNKQNPHLKNYYADLGAVLDAVTDPLATHGLLIVQRFASDQGGPLLITELIHAESGQSIGSTLPIISKDPTDPQKLGGAITYARRYSLLALLGLSPEDDDGNAAAQPRQQRPPQRAAQAPQPFSADEFTAMLETAWAMRKGGDDYAVIIAYFRANRDRMTNDQFADSKEYLRDIKAWMPEGAES